MGGIGNSGGFFAVWKGVFEKEEGGGISGKLAEIALATEVPIFFSEHLICSCGKGVGHDI